MAVLQTKGLTKDFGGKGLFDLDLAVQAGRVHGFLGPNGAGKTTAIRMLLGFLQPDRGAARVLGMHPWDDAAKIRERVGYVPGELALPDHVTGRQFLADSARIRGNVDLDWQNELIERLGAQPDLKIRTLSKGNKQKIALVDAMQHRPELLILDEPTDGLDPLLRHQVNLLLREHAKAGGTVFLSSHVVHEIQETCDEVSIILHGRLHTRNRIDALLAAEPVRVQATLPTLEGAAQALGRVGKHLKRKGKQVSFETKSFLPAMVTLDQLGATDVVVRHDLEDAFLRMYQESK